MIPATWRRLAAFGRDVRGIALIEFAICVPVMIAFFLGGYQLSDASACRRRVIIVARAAADLNSQYAVLSASQVDTILNASTQIMTPYDATNASIRVSQITTDSDGKTSRVSWSRAVRGTALVKGDPFTLPKTLQTKNSSVLYSEVTYTYTPAFGKVVPQLTFTNSLYMMPRVSSAVTCTDC